MNPCRDECMDTPKLFHHLEQLPQDGRSLHLALGVFDGVHLGHQSVIRRAVESSRMDAGKSVLVTFDPHPIRVLAPAKAPASLLATLEHKARIVADLGIDHCVALHFDSSLAAMEAGAFLDLLTRHPVRSIAVGEDWRFGRNRAGDTRFLLEESTRRGYRLETLPPVMFEGERISSTRIRQAIRDGNLDAAARMLGRPYSLSQTVLKGRQLGGQLGFPTANIAPGDAQLPPDGVWVVIATLEDGSRQKGVANLGVRPTVDGNHRLLEVHLLDFSSDLYGKTLEVTFLHHLRPEIRFESIEALRDQIHSDAAAASTWFEKHELDLD